MPPKRPGERLFGNKTEKMVKLMNEEELNIKDDKLNISKIEELEYSFNHEGYYPRMVYLAREVANTPNLSAHLILRLLKFCVDEDNDYIARQLLSNQNFNINTIEGGELLWTAINEHQIEIAKTLVEFKANLKIRKYEDERTVLHEVLRSYQFENEVSREELVVMMLENGADVNARDAKGRSVLNDAIVYKHCSVQLIGKLLDYGAEIMLNGDKPRLNDFFWAANSKPEALLKFIEHQVPDKETRNQRGAMAIYYLISKETNGTKIVDALQMIKKILDLGVPVNSVNSLAEKRCEKQPCPLLSTALFHQEKGVIELLLEYGADPLQKNDFGHTPLFQATAIRNYSDASRWLIERGASIHDRNDDGCYPIHGACETKSLKNIHLFLNLGADLNVTNHEGYTPFSYTDETYYFDEALGLVIKHFALKIVKGGKISDMDMERINKFTWSENYLQKCMKQLEQMKKEKIFDGVPYFSLFSGDIYSVLQVIGNENVVRSFNGDEKTRVEKFPDYRYMLLHAFEIAEKRYEIFLVEKKKLQQVYGETIPDWAVEKITYFSCLDQLKRCRYDFYLGFHANLKNTKANKIKIR